MHIEYDTLHFLPIIWNNNVYHSTENNCCGVYCTVITDTGCLCYMFVSDYHVLNSNNTSTSTDSVLYSLHSGDTK